MAYYYEDKNFSHLGTRFLYWFYISVKELTWYFLEHQWGIWLLPGLQHVYPNNKQTNKHKTITMRWMRGVVSKEAVVFLHWTCSPKVNFLIPPQWPIYGTISTQLIKVKFYVTLRDVKVETFSQGILSETMTTVIRMAKTNTFRLAKQQRCSQTCINARTGCETA